MISHTMILPSYDAVLISLGLFSVFLPAAFIYQFTLEDIDTLPFPLSDYCAMPPIASPQNAGLVKAEHRLNARRRAAFTMTPHILLI